MKIVFQRKSTKKSLFVREKSIFSVNFYSGEVSLFEKFLMMFLSSRNVFECQRDCD